MGFVHADKWGPAGSVVAALCCLGAAPLVGALAAVGLGFLLHDWILIPVLGLCLAATLWALDRDRPRQGSWKPEVVAAAGAGFTLAGLWVSPVVVGTGLVLLLAGSVWNWIRIRGGVKQGGCS